MFSSRFGTTTFADRHASELTMLAQACRQHGVVHPIVLQCGPGGVVSFLFQALGKGKKSELSPKDLRRRFVVKRLETVLRRVPFVRLNSSETIEVLDALSSLQPRRMIVCDREAKVLRHARRQLSASVHSTTTAFDFLRCDLEQAAPDRQADVVIAFCLVERCKDREAALKHLFASVRPGGVLCITYHHAKAREGFKRIGRGLYRRMP